VTVAQRPKRMQAGPNDEGRADGENQIICEQCRLAFSNHMDLIYVDCPESPCWSHTKALELSRLREIEEEQGK